jgi:4-alpha-glucanotransferase
MGQQAYKFVDFLENAAQSWWQILPLSPTGYGDSPYQSASAFAGNPYLIDLDLLAKDGLLLPEEYCDLQWNIRDTAVDFGLIW